MAILYVPTKNSLFVEPNHLSAQRTGQIYAQSKATKESTSTSSGSNAMVLSQLKDRPYNGLFFKINPIDNIAYTDGTNIKGEYLLNFSEVKVYDERKTMGDFNLSFDDCLDGEYYPRLLKTNTGDVYTTNCVFEMVENTLIKAMQTGQSMIDISVGDLLVVDNGMLTKKAEPAATDMVWQIKEITTAPNGIDDAVKIVRVQ